MNSKMMAQRTLLLQLCQKSGQMRLLHVSAPSMCELRFKEQLGNREVVGHGQSGNPWYVDRLDQPYPAVRFRERSAEFEPVLAKEKEDWRQLSMEEKKMLYRYSFRQTFAELKVSPGWWKLSLAMFCGLWCYGIVLQTIQYSILNPLPDSMSEEHRDKMLEAMVAIHDGPVDGIASMYDYENDRWKPQ